MFDTRAPLNINDSDLTPMKIKFPAVCEEFTEIACCLIRCTAMSIVLKTVHLTFAKPQPGTLELAEKYCSLPRKLL